MLSCSAPFACVSCLEGPRRCEVGRRHGFLFGASPSLGDSSLCIVTSVLIGSRRRAVGILSAVGGLLSPSAASGSVSVSALAALTICKAVSSSSPCCSAFFIHSRLAALSVGSAHCVYCTITSLTSSSAASKASWCVACRGIPLAETSPIALEELDASPLFIALFSVYQTIKLKMKNEF
ncbi:hypothetical protein F2Q70_00023167 [Brassica cretica]|uniref:Uncharacterized protein n=1 Tax=Brassica cretica TaxID=69181 RepID=A0A8S9GPH3_BRACR|nr:hypothetical protein F2Q70_00023167 [Brassica cretica]